MSLAEGDIEEVGAPAHAGGSREGARVVLITVVDDPRPSMEAVDAFAGRRPAVVPNYYVDQTGYIRQFVDDARAGNGLELAIYNGRRRNIDRISLSVLMERPAGADYSDFQINALHRLVAFLSYRHKLDDMALMTIRPDAKGRPRVTPYLPPSPTPEVDQGPAAASSGVLLGAGELTPEQALRMRLYEETWRQRGGQPRLGTAFAFYAAKFLLGAPAGPESALVFNGVKYGIMPFARDTIFYRVGDDFAAIQTYDQLLGDLKAPTGMALELVKASYDLSIKATENRVGTITKTKIFKPEYSFHLAAATSNLGPAVSGNYAVTFEREYYFQVFAADTLFTPASEGAGACLLSNADASHPAYHQLWAETYKSCGASYNPDSPFQQRAAQDRLGTPYSGEYDIQYDGRSYRVQVFALDTLFSEASGPVRRMSELPLDPKIVAWSPKPPKAPEAPAFKAPPVITSGIPLSIPPIRPERGDHWPPKPNYWILGDKSKPSREQVLGHIESRPIPNSRRVAIVNDWERQHLVTVSVPQLKRFKHAGFGELQFHKVAADQFVRLWQEIESRGLLDKVLDFAGAFFPRFMKDSTSKLSNHSYGTAFDINVAQNDWKMLPAFAGDKGSVREIVVIANACGFFWGGHWGVPRDGMHFEWAIPVKVK